MITLPDWAYDYSGLTGNELQANSFLKDYYGQMANNYLPSLDTFAQQNAGQMVGYDPNQFMSIEDFGLGTARGDLRNQDLIQTSHNLTLGNDDQGNFSAPYYIKTPDGRYQIATGNEGQELFTRSMSGPTWDNPDGSEVWTSAGNYHRETPQEAAARLLAQGGGYASGGYRNDFMGNETLSDLTSQADTKWGSDPINNPELAKYINDPNWVARDENGNITNIRAELYPLLMRESLGEESRDINRGVTDQSDVFGNLVKMALLGTVTGGLGLAGASALGLGTAAAGAGMGATMAGMGTGGLATAGAIGGGLSAGLTGNDILKGALTGGVLGGVGGIAKGYAPGISDSIGLSNAVGSKLGTNIITGGIKGAASGAFNGDVLSGAVGGMISPAFKGALGQGASYLGDMFSGGEEAMTDQQFLESVGNPDFWDNVQNTSSDDSTFDFIGNGEQNSYTGTGQGDTNMDFEWNQLADIFDMTNGGDPYNLDGWDLGFGEGVGIGDPDWTQSLDIFNEFGVDPYNLDGWDFGDLITDGDSRGYGGNDLQWQQDSDIFDLTNGGDPYNNGGFGFGSESSVTSGLKTGSPGVLGSVKDAVQGLLGGGADGAANSALIYALLQAALKSSQTNVGNRMNADSVNMVVNSGEKGAPNRLGTNFGMTKTAVGSAPPLGAPISNGVFQLGLTRN